MKGYPKAPHMKSSMDTAAKGGKTMAANGGKSGAPKMDYGKGCNVVGSKAKTFKA